VRTSSAKPWICGRRACSSASRPPGRDDVAHRLREQLDDARIEFGELVILGAHHKVAQLRAASDDTAARRRALSERLRRRAIPVDRATADEVRRAGWARP
jgi:hypothetical protein